MDIDFSFVLFVLTSFTGCVLLVNYLTNKPIVKQALNKIYQKINKTKFIQKTQPVAIYIWRWLLDNSRSLFWVVLFVFCVRAFFVEPFQIPSGSMRPTLEVGDFIVVNKMSYGVRLPIIHKRIITWSEVQRGDVVVFNFPAKRTINFIKRVVGVSGDKITYDGVKLTVNNKVFKVSDFAEKNNLEDSLYAFMENNGRVDYSIYRLDKSPKAHKLLEFSVPDNHYFVMGDNRDNSNDSRFWGVVNKDLIQGKALFVWMHWKEFLSIPSFSEARTIQ